MTKYEPGRFDHAVLQEKAQELLDEIERQSASDIAWQIGTRWVGERDAWRVTNDQVELFGEWFGEQAKQRVIRAEHARRKELRGE